MHPDRSHPSNIYDTPEDIETMFGSVAELHASVMNHFWHRIAESAQAVMTSPYWQSRVQKDDLPQPGWVGENYTPGQGLVVVLQNPGMPPENYTYERNSSLQILLTEFKQNPLYENYVRLSKAFRLDTIGGRGTPWPLWSRPVKRIIRDIWDSTEIAWLNVVKVRTPDEEGKNAPVTPEDVKQGIEQLTEELRLLEPLAIVTVGAEARNAVDSMPQLRETERFFITLNQPTNAVADEVHKKLFLLKAGVAKP